MSHRSNNETWKWTSNSCRYTSQPLVPHSEVEMSSHRVFAARKMSISLAASVFLLAVFSLDRVVLPKTSPTSVALASQTRTINLNTGYDQWLASPALISVGGQDNEWRVIIDTTNEPPPATGRPADVVSDNTWINVNPSLAGNFPNSRWISIRPDQGRPLPPPPSKFQYAYYFTLPPGFSSPQLTMKLSSDDQITKVTLNSTTLFQGLAGTFSFPPFEVSTSLPSSFNAGSTGNVITVEVEDTGAGITGLIVDGNVTYQDCARLPIREIPGLTSISFWERTSVAPTAFTPPIGALTTPLNGPLGPNSDFEGVTGEEFYDVFYSNWDGAFNSNGQFVTIEAVWNVGAPHGGGLNIARVDFNGTGNSANSVASFVALGDNALSNNVGKAVDVDPSALTHTTMGNTIGQTQRLRVTVGFPCSCVPPPSGMVAWWPLDETQGAQLVADVVGGHDGTPMNFGGAVTPIGTFGGPKPVTGSYVNNSLLFDGGYVEVPDSPPLNFGVNGKEPFTIDAWVNYSPVQQTRPIVSKLASPSGPGYFLSLQHAGLGVFNLTLQIDGVKYIGPTVPANTWAFVAATRNASGVTLYVGSNNALATPVVRLGSPQDASSAGTTLRIGQTQPAQPHVHSEIDEVEIFNRELNQTELEAIFNAGSAGKCKSGCVPPPSGMIGWWPGNDHPNDLADGNDGTLFCSVGYAMGKVGQAFSFPSLGSTGSDRVGINTGPSANTFTIEAWVFANQHGPSDYRTIYADNSRGFWLKDGRVNWWRGGDRFEGVTQLSIGAWHHIALTYSNNEFTGYLDGEADGTSIFAGESLPTGPGLGIGGHSITLSEDFDGLIDELAIYNRALGLAEIRAIYEAGSSGKCEPSTGTVIIRKNTVGGDDTFSYTSVGAGLGPFSITTSGETGSQTFSNIAPGPASVTEAAPPAGWVFTSLACSDPDNGTTVSGQTANIDLDAGETVVCTYINTKCPTITLNPASDALLPIGINTPYNQTFTATGGCDSSFTFSVTSGALPSGLTLGTDGALSGTATQPGDFTFTVTATDSCGCSQSQTYTLKVNGSLVISRFRQNGPAGPDDEFVEIFNPTNSTHTVSTLAGSGYEIFASAGNGTTSNNLSLVCTIPAGTVLPARGYFLCAGSSYSLGDLGRNGGSATAVGDAVMTADIPNDAGLVFVSLAPFVLFDSVGFEQYGPGAPSPASPFIRPFFCEGTCLQPVGDASINTAGALGGTCPPSVTQRGATFPVLQSGSLDGVALCYGESGQYEFLRRQTKFDPTIGTLHQDTNNNGHDFILVAPNPDRTNIGQAITGIGGVTSVLGAAGPHNLRAPPDIPGIKFKQGPFDDCASQIAPSNAERNFVPDRLILNPANDPLGTFALRLRFTNNSGSDITGVRFRIDDLSTLCGSQASSPTVATGEARNLSFPPRCQGSGTDVGVYTAILKVVNSLTEVVKDCHGVDQTVNGTVMEDLSLAMGPPILPGPGPLSPFGGGIDTSLIVNPFGSIGDGVTGGTGVFATVVGTTPASKVLFIKIRFGVVKSGRFKVLVIPEGK